mmetsp:Transcript_6713/g.12190  ORF Transcript_6713/g.12190 Transcript_6713/m.12190 type:complete len:217 (-) Transcript_6713:257-907(-)
MMSDISPTRRAKAASSNFFCIFPRVKLPRSPPFLAEPQSECSLANSWNFFRRSAESTRASFARKPAKNSAASSELQVIRSWRQDEGLREPLCLRMMCNACTSSVLVRFAAGSALSTSPQLAMTTFLEVFPLELPHFSTFATTSKPDKTFPKTTCLPSRCGVGPVHMKNCEPFVLGPAFAIDKQPFPVCFILKFSSLNFSPYIDSPPVPSPRVKSPP